MSYPRVLGVCLLPVELKKSLTNFYKKIFFGGCSPYAASKKWLDFGDDPTHMSLGLGYICLGLDLGSLSTFINVCTIIIIIIIIITSTEKVIFHRR